MFCDQVGPRAEEDIISRWVSKELEPVGPISTDFLTEVPDQPIVRHTKQFGSLATLKLPRTCADCNGGWMSRLEEATRPILEPLIRRCCRDSDIRRSTTNRCMGPAEMSDSRRILP